MDDHHKNLFYVLRVVGAHRFVASTICVKYVPKHKYNIIGEMRIF